MIVARKSRMSAMEREKEKRAKANVGERGVQPYLWLWQRNPLYAKDALKLERDRTALPLEIDVIASL